MTNYINSLQCSLHIDMMSLSWTKNKLIAHMLNVKELGLAQISSIIDVSFTFGVEEDLARSFFAVEALIWGV